MTCNKIVFPDGSRIVPLGQGTWNMGKNKTEEIKALQLGIDLGLELIDTAEMYGTEELVGEAVRGRRDKAFIVSKVLPSNASYAGTKEACERSLHRLDTDYIDLYLLHWIGSFPYSETVKALSELKQEGKILRWGMSNLDLCDMEQIISLPQGTECATNQVLYNLRERGIEYDLVPWSKKHGIPLMAYTPLGEGRLKNDPVLQDIAIRHNASTTQIMLSWIMRNGNMIAIPKASNAAHVEDNARSLSISLTAEDFQQIDTAFPPPSHKIKLAGW